jgi:hypothetical protein
MYIHSLVYFHTVILSLLSTHSFPSIYSPFYLYTLSPSSIFTLPSNTLLFLHSSVYSLFSLLSFLFTLSSLYSLFCSLSLLSTLFSVHSLFYLLYFLSTHFCLHFDSLFCSLSLLSTLFSVYPFLSSFRL